ncbi:MAG TPA: peptidoglycan DD-metalloendopeptidase family protein [Poseidonia sp.]|nr:peptidoglycan DD-metalloendopeptidase family protein [Poseidonia sp.]
MDNAEDAFHPTVVFDEPYWVHAFTRHSTHAWDNPFVYSVGRYNEHRPEMYTTELFEGVRDIHVGLDLGGPAGTPVHAFDEGTVYDVGINEEDGSYGPTLITQHHVTLPLVPGGPRSGSPITFWVLYGHLSMKSIEGLEKGYSFERGEQIATFGDEHENGGWPPHVHIQISLEEPEKCDLPGVVESSQRAKALEIYLDPRLICGPLY